MSCFYRSFEIENPQASIVSEIQENPNLRKNQRFALKPQALNPKPQTLNPKHSSCRVSKMMADSHFMNIIRIKFRFVTLRQDAGLAPSLEVYPVFDVIPHR